MRGVFCWGPYPMSFENNVRSLRTRATLVKVFAWTFVAATVFQIGALGYETFKPPVDIVVSAGPVTEPAFPLWAMIVGIIALILPVAILGLMLCTLIWVYKAHRNLADENVDMDYSAGWAVGSYFVPFINLIVPMRAMRELHNRSHGEVPELAHSPVDDVAAWWTAYIVGIVLSLGLILKLAIDVATNIVFLTPVWMEFAMAAFASLLFVISAVMLVKLVGAITQAQTEGNHAWKAFE